MSKQFKCMMLVLLVAFLLTAFPSISVYAETEIPIDVQMMVDAGETQLVRGLTVGYDHNQYVSVRDMQKLLARTDKAFLLELSDGKMELVMEQDVENIEAETGEKVKLSSADDYERELGGWTRTEKDSFSNKALALNKIIKNGQNRRYYSILMKINGRLDCYMAICDFCMLLDMDATFEEGIVHLNPAQNMQPCDPRQLEHDGFFQGVNGILVGDATTGEIFYGYQEEQVFPIASTTKLMTYLLAADALRSGQIHYDDMVPISEEAVALSKTSDGVTPMKLGQSVSVRELLYGALIASSNECDHAISEWVAGDEEAAVALMNQKAAELSMDTAEFYNCNGLPVYAETLIPAKKQNRMSCEDMFRLASHILNTYPEVKEITSIPKIQLEVLQKEIKNTNPLLYNMPEVNGLKTGTTNKSGACLVTSLTVNDGMVDHDIVVVLLGAENSQDRGRVSELMARYGKAVVLGQAEKGVMTAKAEESDWMNANAIVNMIVNKALQIKERK